MIQWIKGGFGRRAEQARKKYQPHLLAHHNQLILNKAKEAHRWMREPQFRHPKTGEPATSLYALDAGLGVIRHDRGQGFYTAMPHNPTCTPSGIAV